MDEFMGQVVSMVVMMTVVASVVALIIIYLVTSLLIEENRNSISLLKIFGYRRREIRSLILNSSTPGHRSRIHCRYPAGAGVYGGQFTAILAR